MLNRTFNWIRVQTRAKLDDAVNLIFGTGDNFQMRYDSANDRLVIDHPASGNTWVLQGTGEFEMNSLAGSLTGGTTIDSITGGNGNTFGLFSASARTVDTTTSTEYENLQAIGIVPFPFNRPNVETRVRFTALIQNDTADEDVTVRLKNLTNASAITGTEVTHTGTAYTAVSSPLVAFNPTAPKQMGLEAKVTAGTGLADRVTVDVQGVLQ